MSLFEFMQSNPVLTLLLYLMTCATVLLSVDCITSAFKRRGHRDV